MSRPPRAVGLLQVAVVVGQHLHDRRPLLLDEPQRVVAVEQRMQHEAGTAREGRSDHRREARRPEERELAVHPIIGCESLAVPVAPALQHGGTVHVEDTLGQRGRPGAVDDDAVVARRGLAHDGVDDVVGYDVAVGEELVPRLHHAAVGGVERDDAPEERVRGRAEPSRSGVRRQVRTRARSRPRTDGAGTRDCVITMPTSE